MDKQEAITLINGIRSTFLYGVVLIRLGEKGINGIVGSLRQNKGAGFEKRDGTFHTLDLITLANELMVDESRHTLHSNLILIQKFELVRLTHEIVNGYAEDTNQHDAYKSTKIYPFVRIVRNALAHGIHPKISWPPKMKDVPFVEWRDHVIRQEEKGQELHLQFGDAICLHEDLTEVLKNELA